MLNFFENAPERIHPYIHKRLFERLVDSFHQSAFSEIRKDTSKLRTYALFKREVGLENYLTEMKNVYDRVQVTKFRLSNHRLMIEVGRHTNTPKEQRFCPFCPNLVENELHFMFTCATYTHLRRAYLDPVCNTLRSFRFLPHDAKLQVLLSNLEQGTGKFIALSMGLRKFLTSNPKRND
jgi:hypothetical protein